MKCVKVVAALLVEPGPLFFAQQRLPGGPRGDLWEFPGGKVEPGEREIDALARELREELGIEVQVGERIATNVHAYADLTVELVLFRARVIAGSLRAAQAQAVRWGSAAELRALSFAEADVPFLPLLADIRE